MALVVDGDKQSHWLLELEPKLLSGLAHRGGVNYGHQLLRILREQLEEQPLVSLQQVKAVDVLIDWVPVTGSGLQMKLMQDPTCSAQGFSANGRQPHPWSSPWAGGGRGCQAAAAPPR